MRAHDLISVFPFSKSSTIELVSYGAFDEEAKGPPFGNDGRVDESKFVEQKALTKNQVDSLVDILYNYTFDPKLDSIIYGISECFWPRNAFIFRDKKHKIVARIGVCFECSRFEFYPQQFKPVDFCDGKVDMLMGFMQRAGIRFGLKRPAGIEK